ncbi:MAG: hypothetical protein LBD50_00265 [Rickettsiales bacterium]|nr:hypothetical protein [Rickettsiales bacterium]
MKKACFLGILASAAVLARPALGDAPSMNDGNVQGDFTMNGGVSSSSIVVSAGNSLNINNNGAPVNNVKFNITNSITLSGDLMHNAGLAGPGSGSFSILDNGQTEIIAGGDIMVSGKIIAGGGDLILTGASVQAKELNANSGSNLVLNTDVISLTDTAVFAAGGNTTINSDFSNNPSLTAGVSISIGGGLYMGDSADASDAVQIASASDDNVYKFETAGTFVLDGNLEAEKGKIIVEAGLANISKNVLGNIDFDAGDLSLGGASLNANPDWQLRLDHTSDGSGGYIGNLFADGTINSDGDILIGGSVNGDLYITSNSDMWVGQDLLGYWEIDVENLYVLGSVSGGGNITADTINIGGDLSGNIIIDADSLNVEKDVLGGTVFRPNMPDGPDGFHLNPDTGDAGPFKKINTSISGIYYFDDDSYLQLVLNSDVLQTDGSPPYDPYSDDALLKVGGLDASGLTKIPNLSDMNSTPNIEILVDNISEMIRKIRLIEVAPGGMIDLGRLDFAGVWFYWDDDSDNVNDRRLFQEAHLVAEGDNIYAILATMNSIEKITKLSPDASGNDIQIAAAVDDLILARLRNYIGYSGDDLGEYYTAVMRMLFLEGDTYHKLMLQGDNYADALDVMVSESPALGLDFARGLGLNDAAAIGARLAVSGRISRNVVADQLIDDFTWKRYYDKNIGWVRVGFGDDVVSFNFGADARIRKFIAGFSFGYNRFDFGMLDGTTMNLGLYGTYEMNDWARLYANANLAMHSANAKTDNLIAGELESGLSAADTTIDVGVMHKIFDNYATGRGYLTFGLLGGYKLAQQNYGRDFMDISAQSRFMLAPGYEISLGKDIWLSVGSFVRPSVKLGVEYDLLGAAAARDLQFKFSESSTWREWKSGDADSLWLRYGGQIDFSFIVGTNFSIGYEVLKNGDFKSNQVKLSGVYRF